MRFHDPADHYALLQSEPDARRRLVADPKSELQELFGFVPAGNYDIEAVEQRDDTIIIMLPTPPSTTADVDSALEQCRGRIYDILFTDGVGGYLIPDDSLTWILRDMRSAWIASIAEDGAD